jgi:iron complex transport system ATP-binding protein
MLSCAGVTLEVAGRVLCKDLALRFEPGEVWAVLGRNGTGKSTLVHVLAGIERPPSGRVELDGAAVDGLDARRRALAIGLLPQIEEGTYWGTVMEYVLLGRFPHTTGWAGFDAEDESTALAALDAVGMNAFVHQRYATLSGGERQRVRIGQILAQQPRIFLLDEPLQHLDLAHQGRVLDVVGRRAREHRDTAIMVLHEPLWIGAACTHVLVFDGAGGIEAGPVDVLLTREKLERAYGCRLREVVDGRRRSFLPDV